MSKTSDIDLLLLGKTGNGKSALGNAILGWPKFKAKFSLSSMTKKVEFAYTKFKSQTIKVVDCPGVGDTRLDQEGGKELIAQAIQEAIAVNPRGYHAFLLVVNFICRFTAEDKGTINFLKSLFGKEFLRRYCILVFTFGDIFESQNAGKTIEQWCREQDGEFKEVLDDCQHRVVLFDNATKDEKKQEAQVDSLLEVVKNLPNHGQRYSDANFELARAARERVFAESKKPVIREETYLEATLILQKLGEVRKNYQQDEQIPHLKQLRTKIVEFIRSDQDQDITESFISLKKSIDDSIFVQSIAAEERKKMEEKEKDIRSRIDQGKEKIKDQLHAREKKNEKERKGTGAGLGSKHQETEEKQFGSKADTDRAAAERRRKVEENMGEIIARVDNIMQRRKDSTDSTIALQRESVEGRANIEQELNRVRLQLEEEQASRAERENEILEKLKEEQQMSQNEIDRLKKELKKIKEFSTCVLL